MADVQLHSGNLEVAASIIHQPVYVGVRCARVCRGWIYEGVKRVGGITPGVRHGERRGRSAALARRAPVHGQGSPTAPRLRRNPATARSFLFCFNSMCCLCNLIVPYLGQIISNRIVFLFYWSCYFVSIDFWDIMYF